MYRFSNRMALVALATASLTLSATGAQAVSIENPLFVQPGGVHTSALATSIPPGPGGDFDIQVLPGSLTIDPGYGGGSPVFNSDGTPVDTSALVLDHEPFVFYDIILMVAPPGGGGTILPTLVRLGATAVFQSDGGQGPQITTDPVTLETSVQWPYELGFAVDSSLPDGTPIVLEGSGDGMHTVTRLGPPGSDFQVDSFFDITYRVSFDGGNNFNEATSPQRFTLTSVVPEPTAAVLTLAAVALLACRRR